MLPLTVLTMALLERLPQLRFRPARLVRRHLATDVVYLLTGYVAAGALGGAYVTGATAWLDARTGVARLVWPAVPFWAQVLFALVAIDFGNYGAHWLLHRSDRLWQFHKAHHSSLELDVMATFRSHLVEQGLRRLLAPVLLIVAGVPVGAVSVAAGVFFVWAMLNHANLRLPLGPLESVLITPRLHRVHHVPATTERNLGTVFTCWDRLRGTFVLADPPPTASFGLPLERESYPQSWARQLVAPWSGSGGRSQRLPSALRSRSPSRGPPVPGPGSGGPPARLRKRRAWSGLAARTWQCQVRTPPGRSPCLTSPPPIWRLRVRGRQ